MKKLLVIAILLFSVITVSAQKLKPTIIPTFGDPSVRMETILFDNGTLYVLGNTAPCAAVYSSKNGGKTFSHISGNDVPSVNPKEQVMTINGHTYTVSNKLWKDGEVIFDMEVADFCMVGNIGYLVDESGSIFRTGNGGKDWKLKGQAALSDGEAGSYKNIGGLICYDTQRKKFYILSPQSQILYSGK